jgi:hypothetical protein
MVGLIQPPDSDTLHAGPEEAQDKWQRYNFPRS